MVIDETSHCSPHVEDENLNQTTLETNKVRISINANDAYVTLYFF